MITAPVLAFPNFDKPFRVYTDASGTGIGTVLTQENNNRSHPIAYASRTLTKAETVYPTIEKEALAIVYAVKYFRPYLYGKPFTLITDHRPLKWLIEHQHTSPRLTRWGLLLQEYDITIIHTPGKDNKVADALSRMPCSRVGAILRSKKTPKATNTKHINVTYLPTDTKNKDRLLRDQNNDVIISDIIDRIKSNSLVNPRYYLEDGILFRKSGRFRQLVVPEAMRSELLESYHDDIFGAHLGTKKNYQQANGSLLLARNVSRCQ